MLQSLNELARPEVKAMLSHGGRLWLATHQGLYLYEDRKLRPVSAWQGQRVKALGPAADGFVIAVENADGPAIHLCRGDGEPRTGLPLLPQDELKSLSAAEGVVWAGGKKGIYRLEGKAWKRAYGEGRCEVVRIDEQPGGVIVAYAKKQGTHETPAAIVSSDRGASWRIEHESWYHDAPIAVRGGTAITRWRGTVEPGVPGKPAKEPTMAALIADGVTVAVTGSKLKIERASGFRLEVKHPRLAEAEQVVLQDDAAIVAGVQGAYRVDLATARLEDLFADVAIEASAAKIKKLHMLDGRRLLATSTFGAFLSEDGGGHWQACEADWDVLDSEALAQAANGSWFLAGQRGLFRSDDGGRRWKHVKLSTMPEHFGELTGVAVADDRLVLAAKRGLFAGSPGLHKDCTRIEGLGTTPILGVASSADGAPSVIVGLADGRLIQVGLTAGTISLVGTLPHAARPIVARGSAVYAVTKNGFFRVTPGGSETLTPADAMGEIHVAQHDGSFLLWTRDRAWLRRSGSEQWQEIASWPRGVKSGLVAPDLRRIVATDRTTLFVREAA